MYLNCHTYFSLRYGTISIELLVETAVKLGIKKIALTDINSTSAIFDFVSLCKKRGIEPVVGVEFRVDDKLQFICLAKNQEGLSEINEFRNKYNLSKEPFPNRVPSFLNVCTIYPLECNEFVLNENEFIGVQLHEIHQLYKYDYKKFVVIHPVTFLDKLGYNLHRLLRAVDGNCLLSKLPKSKEAKEHEYFVTPDELINHFKNYPELVENSKKLISKCDFIFKFDTPKNKKFYTTSKADDLELLRKLTKDGLIKRYGVNNKEAQSRIDNELRIIDQLDFCSYFLITWDIIKYARSRGYFHIGRGSGANSIVAYCLEITDVDPILLDLYFERFINPSRTSPPDFDLDFSWDERDEIIDYTFKRYGADYVCLLATHVTFHYSSACRELGKVFGLPKHEIDELVSSYRENPSNSYTRLILRYGKLMEDFPNYLSIHAGGILISEEKLTNYTSLLAMPKGFVIGEFDMYTCEDIGFAKFDVLSQRGLGHIKDTVDLVWKNKRISIDIHAIQDFKDDENIKNQLKKHETMGCFYIESPAMRQLIWKLKCEDYITLVAASSIIRPGVASSGMMGTFIKRHLNPETVEYIHPKMEELLFETYGVMVYQEDVIKVAHSFGGLSLAQADVLRRGMSGKYRSRLEFDKIVEQYFENCKRFGYDDDIAKEVWRQIQSFAGYSFSKAHSASYAVESYQSLYLKTYFPHEFMVGVINNFGGFYETEFYIHEAKRVGAIIELPDINGSNLLTDLKGNIITLGFIHVKGLEKITINQIIGQRNIRPFSSFDDFCKRVYIGLEQMIILIRISAFRMFGYSKKELLWETHFKVNKKNTLQTSELFYVEDVHYQLPSLYHHPAEDIYDEFELLGFTLQKPFLLVFQKPNCEYFASNLSTGIGKVIEILGYLVSLKPTRTKKGERMFFGYWVDEQGEFFDTVHFPNATKMYPFRGKGVYHLKGKVCVEYGHCSIQINWMQKLPFIVDPRME
ncbi:DNA polymerase-3 subunit alpha [Arcicella rosea]|uniref:DNA polymerase III subunit alpha n=1 Tax=Arcicella gelida TaxID=2984195 RepID=A0ABU5S2W4_9BACT|nr:DNA polymerase III subunit alpha [Arcicella sp. DC2W]MEA5402823.1 DNA polymerase III subunit alpha [Arcicella sp. DC2W]